MKRILLACTLLCMSTLASAGSLSVGSKSLGIKLSGAKIGQEDYTILGLTGHYFVLDDLSIGAGYEYWFGDSPSLSKLTVESTYFIPVSENIRPYAGILLNKYLINSGHTNTNSYGFRTGLAFVNAPIMLSAGIKQEYFSNTNSFFAGNDLTYEFLIGISI